MLNYYALPGMLNMKDPITTNIILNTVSKYFDVPVAKIMSKSRYSKLVMARQVAQYLMRNQLHMNYSELGRVFERDHTSIIHSVKYINEQMTLKNPDEIVNHLDNIKKELKWHSLQHLSLPSPL